MRNEKDLLSANESEDNELKEYFRDVESMLRREAPHLATFAGDSSLTYTPSLTDETFSFAHKNSEVTVPLKWYVDKKVGSDGLRFALYHELSHFIDMRNNPEEYLNNFDYMLRGKSNDKICKWIEDKMKEEKMSENKIKEMTEVKKRSDGESYSNLQVMAQGYVHRMFNILDDISVNKLVQQKAPRYSQPEGIKDIESVYDYVGFSNPDLTKQPEHSQLLNKLLRDEMLPNSPETVVSDDVMKVINKKIYGKNIKEWIEKLKPVSGQMVPCEERYKIIKNIIEPVYLDLLKKHIDNQKFEETEKEAKQISQENSSGSNNDGGENQQQKEGGGDKKQKKEKQEGDDKEEKDGEGGENEGEGKGNKDKEKDQNGEGEEDEGEGQDGEGGENEGEGNKDKEKGQDGEGEGEGDENGGKEKDGGSDDNSKKGSDSNPSPGIGGDESIRKMLKKLLDQKKYDKMSPEERQKANVKNMEKQFDEEYDISLENRQDFNEISKKIEKARLEMRHFWKNLIGKGLELSRHKKSGLKRGNLNVDNYIEKYPDIVEGTQAGNLDNLEIYERFLSEMQEVSKPERIEISLVCDLSASMDSDDREKLKEAVMLLLLSLKDFNLYLDQSRKETKTKLSSFSEVYVFGDFFQKIKTFKEKIQHDHAEDAKIIKTLTPINTSFGGTNDVGPMSDVLDSVDAKKEEEIKKGKIKKIVFEITDGGSNDPKELRGIIDSMIEKGVIPLCLQIKDGNYSDYAWNDDRKTKLAHVVNDINELPEKLIDNLKKVIGPVRL